MADPTAPAPPKVRAPQRIDGDATPAEAVAPAVGAEAAPVGVGAPQVATGAEVTAVVTGAQPPGAPFREGVPTTATPATPHNPITGLARTGGDTVLLLAFALTAVLLGALLVRLGKPRPATSPQGAS